MKKSDLKQELESISKIELGEKIKKKRESSGLSQSQLAEIMDCDQSTISAIEKGNNKFSLKIFIEIAHYFNDSFGVISIKELLGSDEVIKKRFDTLRTNYCAIKPTRRAKADLYLETLEREVREQLLLSEIENQLKQEKNTAQKIQSEIQELGNIDEFNVEEAVEKYETLENTIEAWYQFEGKEMPEGFGLNFSGWENLSLEDKIATVKDIKNFADKMNAKIDSGEIDDE